MKETEKKMTKKIEGTPRIYGMKAKDRKRSAVSNAIKRWYRRRPEKNPLE